MYKDYPLTKQQLGLWIEQKLHPSNTSYNTCVKIKLMGPLDEEKFRRATLNVINFFDTLKVYFVEKKGIPYQRIDGQVEYLPELIDISNGQADETLEKEKQAKRILSDKLNTAIDLTQFPIMRASLIKTANGVYYFIGMVPHIVSDGRSAILYLESLSIAYNQGQQGLIDTYGKTKKNWVNYTEDGLFEVDEQANAANRQHWKQRLEKANHYFDYSYGKNLIDPDDKRGERVYFDLSPDIAKQLKAHCKLNRTTLFNVFVCVFSIFIHKYYQLNDLLIGYPVNIRPPGYKHFFGFFVNILPIRVDMRGSPTYLELLKRVHQTRKGDKDYQKYPALDIVADIRDELPDFDGRVFNLSMAQTVSRFFDLDLDGIESQPLETEYYDVNDDFSLSYELIEDRIGLWFEYHKSLFEHDFINQAMQHIERIIVQLLDEPETRIGDFKLLSTSERENLLSVSLRALSRPLEKTNVKKHQENSIHVLFESQVAKTPSGIAIVDGDHSFTYSELNGAANRLAKDIQDRLAAPQQAVAVSLNRSFELIVSLLAVLKAGCFYVPIPVEYPNKRKRHIIQDANVQLILVDVTHGDEHTKLMGGVQFIDLRDRKIITAKNTVVNGLTDNIDAMVEPDSLSYIIYTSGSTGQPKGVVLKHTNVIPRLIWLRDYYKLNANDSMLQNTDFSFDVSVAEIFWPLISGASLVIARQSNRAQTDYLDVEYLLRLIAVNKITVSCFVPSLLRVLIANDKAGQLSSLKHVLSAGEALPEQLRQAFYSNASTRSSELYNFYGPTEAAIYSSFEKVSPREEISIGIGSGLDGTSLFVLDQQRDLVPMGVVGELYIGGDSIASGYQSNVELTDKVFIPDPFSENSRDRLYATGDYVRYHLDGRLEYVGRVDQQIKIRGFRVELGEIESIIAHYHGISDLAVTDYSLEKSGSQLVVYLVQDKKVDTEQAEIVRLIKASIAIELPHYMRPSIFSFVDHIPRHPSGKLNRAALPHPQANIINVKEFSAAKTVIENQLVDIWARILSIASSKISMNESFFDLGGDSLMAIQFVSLAEKEGLFFDMGDLFVLRNIRELGAVAKTSRDKIFVQDDISGSYPLLPRQAKFFSDDFSNPNHWNRTFSFDLNHRLDIVAFQSAVLAILKHHDNLRVKFTRSESNTWQQNCCLMEDLAPLKGRVFKCYDLMSVDAPAQNIAMQDQTNRLHKEINLQQAPLIRIGYFATSANAGKLAIVFHHLLLDMVSSRLIFEDLMSAYQGAKEGLHFSFPAKTTSIKEWASFIGKHAVEADFSKATTYWGNFPRHALPSIPLDFELSKEKYGSKNSEGNARTLSFVVDAMTTQKLLVSSLKQWNMPIQDFLLASFFQVITDWTGHNSMTVSTCGHGREIDSKQHDLSRTVGWVNTVYPVYLKMDEDCVLSEVPTLQYVEEIRKQLSAIPKENVDYNILRYLTKHSAIIAHESPRLFFNYVGQIDAIVPKSTPFIPRNELPGVAGIAPENHLCYQLYFEAGVVAGQLLFRVTYSNRLFKNSTIDKLTSELVSVIKKRANDLD